MLWFFVEPRRYLGAPAPWSIGGSPSRHRPSDLVWSGDDILVRGTWRPTSFVEKLLSGKQDQCDRELGMSLGGLALVACQGVSRRDLVAEKQYS